MRGRTNRGVGERRAARLASARLYLVIDGGRAGETVAAALRGGVDIVQLREKAADDEAIMTLARELRTLCDQHGALLIVNDRPDIALAARADGVHVGQSDTPVGALREVVGANFLIGLSTHAPDQIDAGAASTADYLGVGPVYETPTKPGVAAVGEALVRYAAEHLSTPFFAIGGITALTAPVVARAGAERIAVVRAIRDAADPQAAAEALLVALGRPAGRAR